MSLRSDDAEEVLESIVAISKGHISALKNKGELKLSEAQSLATLGYLMHKLTITERSKSEADAARKELDELMNEIKQHEMGDEK